MDQITAKLTHIEGLIDALGRAYSELEALATSEGAAYAPLVEAIQIRQKHLQGVIDKAGSSSSLRGVLAEIRRSKGPRVRMQWVDYLSKPDREYEVIRRTEARVLLRDNGDMSWFNLGTGEKVGALKGCCRWRIRKDEIEKIRALPVGHNEVSRAVESGR